MASSMDLSPPPLKSKLSQVKYLLDDANERLQKEMTKNYEIFKTKTSASGSSNSQHHQQQANLRTHQDASIDLKRTISDISTLRSVLSCPIFDRIVNVTDSLDKLSYQLNLHPSIGPSDINIDSNGELILAPPIEPTSLNNLINSKLDEYSDHSNLSPHILSPNILQNTSNHITMNNNNGQHNMSMQAQPGSPNYPLGTTITTTMEVLGSNGYQVTDQQQHEPSNKPFNQQQYTSSMAEMGQGIPNNYAQNQRQRNNVPQTNNYDTEKLVSNGVNKTYATSNKVRRNQETNNNKVASLNDENRKLHNSNGQLKLDQVQVNGSEAKNIDFQSTQSMNQVGQHCDQPNDIIRNAFSNEMYRATDELNHDDEFATANQQLTQSNGQNLPDSYMQNVQVQNSAISTNGKVRSSQNSCVPYNRDSCSPSTSAGSTVRLADECDSGASSYQSQTGKTPYQTYPYKVNEQVLDNQTVIISPHDAPDSMEQELNDNISPEMERIKVTLEKDGSGLGITIAGYICEKEEISGIFIKSITPNSPAARSGKIRTLDQIFAVNGRELLGYSNKDALDVLKYTGKVVTLELMRYLAESKYQKLQTALANAKPTLNTNSRLANSENVPSLIGSKNGEKNQSPTKSSIPVSKIRDNSQSPTKQTMLASPNDNQRQTLVQVSNYKKSSTNQITGSCQLKENSSDDKGLDYLSKGSIVKNAINQLNNSQAAIDSQIPIAAQRGGTNKVIETKQGARNTIDIRSPICQTNNATYVNKVGDYDFCDSSNRNISKTVCSNRETSDDIRRLIKSQPEWEKEAVIIELHKDSSQGLGFTVKDYTNPKDPNQLIIMITSLSPGGIAEKDGRLSSGDLLIFVDDINLEGASLDDAVRALKKTNGQVTLGVLKLKRT